MSLPPFPRHFSLFSRPFRFFSLSLSLSFRFLKLSSLPLSPDVSMPPFHCLSLGDDNVGEFWRCDRGRGVFCRPGPPPPEGRRRAPGTTMRLLLLAMVALMWLMIARCFCCCCCEQMRSCWRWCCCRCCRCGERRCGADGLWRPPGRDRRLTTRSGSSRRPAGSGRWPPARSS